MSEPVTSEVRTDSGISKTNTTTTKEKKNNGAVVSWVDQKPESNTNPPISSLFDVFYRNKLTLTCMLFAHINVGFETIMGVTLPFLSIRVQTPINVVGYCLTVLSVTFMLGALISGSIFSLFKGRPRKMYFLAATLTISGCSLLAVPFMHTFPSLVFAAAIIGCGVGSMDTAHHSVVVETFGPKMARTFIFLLHLLSSLGAFTMTGVVRLFLGDPPGQDFIKDGYCRRKAEKLPDKHRGIDHHNDYNAIRWPYLIAAVHNFLAASMYLLLTVMLDIVLQKIAAPDTKEDVKLAPTPCLQQQKTASKTLFDEEMCGPATSPPAPLMSSHITTNAAYCPGRLPLRHPNLAIALLSVEFFFIGAKTAVYWFDLFSFAMCSPLQLNSRTAHNLEHVFLGCYVFVRLIGVLCGHMIDSRIFLAVNLLASGFCNVMLSIVGNDHLAYLFVLVALAGFSHSTSVANLFNWSSEQMQFNSTHASLISAVTFFGVGLGYAVSPPVAGYLFITPVGAIGVFYYAAALSAADLALFIVLDWLFKQHEFPTPEPLT